MNRVLQLFIYILLFLSVTVRTYGFTDVQDSTKERSKSDTVFLNPSVYRLMDSLNYGRLLYVWRYDKDRFMVKQEPYDSTLIGSSL